MDMLSLECDDTLWSRFFLVAPLVVVGTLEEDGQPDFAPKHMATPLGWGPWFGFACAPTHRTYANARREGCFTVSYLKPDAILAASLAAAPHQDAGPKPEVRALAHQPATRVPGQLLEGSYLHLECRLERVVEDLGPNVFLIGRVVAAQLDPACARRHDLDDADLLRQHPLLAYLTPGRWASVGSSHGFPFPAGFCR